MLSNEDQRRLGRLLADEKLTLRGFAACGTVIDDLRRAEYFDLWVSRGHDHRAWLGAALAEAEYINSPVVIPEDAGVVEVDGGAPIVGPSIPDLATAAWYYPEEVLKDGIRQAYRAHYGED